MNDEIDFGSDIKNYVECTTFENYDIVKYENADIIEKFMNWFLFYKSFYNKINKLFLKILYCLLTNSGRLINSNYDCYNFDLDKFINIIQVKNKKKIQIKKKADIIIIFDFTNLNKYKLYQIKNKNIEIIDLKKYKPTFKGNLNDLKNDFKKLSKNYNFNLLLNKTNKILELCNDIENLYKIMFKE